MDRTNYAQSVLKSVAMVSPGWPVEAMANGITSYVASISRGLGMLGVDCHVLTPQLLGVGPGPLLHLVKPEAKSLISKIMRRASLERWRINAFCAALTRTLHQLHRDSGLQLVEVEESYGWTRFLAGSSPVPIVVRLHGPWFLNGIANGVTPDANFHRRDRWEKAGIIAADGITAPSKDVLEQTRSHYGLELSEARVIPNPVETVAPADRWTLQGCDRNRIAFVGRFDRHKGGDTMLDAFAKIVREFPDARLDFVGPDRGCMDESGSELKINDYLSRKLTDPDREKIKYHGFLPGSAAAELRRRALVTVAPSRYETFGIASAEAMMAGCPVVVCGAGALNELVQDDRNGLVAKVADSGDVAEKVVALLKDPQRAAKLGERAAIDAAERYAPDVIAQETAEFYRAILDRNRGRASHGESRSGAKRPASVPACY